VLQMVEMPVEWTDSMGISWWFACNFSSFRCYCKEGQKSRGVISQPVNGTVLLESLCNSCCFPFWGNFATRSSQGIENAIFAGDTTKTCNFAARHGLVFSKYTRYCSVKQGRFFPFLSAEVSIFRRPRAKWHGLEVRGKTHPIFSELFVC